MDTAKHLREHASRSFTWLGEQFEQSDARIMTDAADEIDYLQAERRRLRLEAAAALIDIERLQAELRSERFLRTIAHQTIEGLQIIHKARCALLGVGS